MSTGVVELEKRIVTLIEEGLRSRQIDAVRAQSIAQAAVMNLKDTSSDFQLYQAAEELAKSFPELTGVAAQAEEHYEDRIRDAVVSHARSLIMAGDTEQATALLFAAIAKNQEIPLNG